MNIGLLSHATENEDVAQCLRNRRRDPQHALAARIRAGVERGDLPANSDARSIATSVSAVLQGMAIQARDGASRDTLESIARLAIEAWPQP